jgi:hypothetical protein
MTHARRAAIVCGALTAAVFLLLSPAVRASGPAPFTVGIEMRNVSLHIADGVILVVHSLDGVFISRGRNKPPIFDDPQSYTMRMKVADVEMDAPSLTTMMRLSLSKQKSPLEEPQIAFENGEMHITGKIKKGAAVPFSLHASVSVTADGMMRLHPTKLSAVGIPVKGMLELFGFKVGNLIKMPAGSGMKGDGDDLLLDTAAMMPPPRTEAKLQRVAISGTHLQMTLVGNAKLPERPATLPLPSAKNYLYFFGGSIRFGKLTMSEADMQLIDADQHDPFDFFPAHYDAQLLAGYSHNTARKGLQVYMPDYADVGRGPLTPPHVPHASPHQPHQP